MAKEEKNNNFALLAIVGIVAIVGVIVLLMGSRTSPAMMTGYPEVNLAGDARQVVIPGDSKFGCSGLSYTQCAELPHCYLTTIGWGIPYCGSMDRLQMMDME